MEKSVPSAKKKFSIRDIMTIAAMMVICFIIMMVMSSLTLPFPLVYLYGSAGIDGFICAVFFLVAANRVNKHGLLFAWAGIYGLIQGVMGYMFLFPYFLAVGLIAELSMLGKDTYRNPLRTRIGWTINCVGNFVGCAVPLWWAWDSYTAMALESGFTSETLEMQMATMIGASGIRLSGGERQRIAIARAIIKDAPIIVLDEATAFSDPENEYLIQKAFEKLIQNKTVIMIAHRLSTIRNADQILVMEHGQLIEQGTHDTLMERQGKYTQMWNSYMESISWKIRAGKGGAIE